MVRVLIPALLSALVGCGGGAQDDGRMPAVLITLDTTNPNALDVYGTDRELTPHLAGLAAEGVVYERARAVTPLTMPSHSSMLTGLYPVRHTVRDNAWLPLPASADTLAERATAAGFRTAAFLAASVLRRSYGLDQGFELYDEAPRAGARTGQLGERRARAVTDAALGWLDGRDGLEPYFLWVHYFDAHAPYDPPPPALARAEGRPYLGEVAFMDEQIGRLLERLRSEPDWERTMVLVVADHGEGAGRHGESTHGMLAYDSTLAVPMFVRFPGGGRAGERSQEVTSLVDVYPTMLAAMGLSVPPGIDGLDLGSGPVPPDRGVYFESYYGYLNYGWAPLSGWADSTSKYIHGSKPQLFAAEDSGEERDLFRVDDPRVERARANIERLAERPRLERAEQELSVSSQDGLTELGYAGAASAEAPIPEPLEDSSLPAPREAMPEHYRSWEALAMADAGRLPQAIETLREITEGNPGNAFAHDRLGELLLRAGRAEEALVPLLAMVERGLERPNLRLNLTKAYAQLGRYEEALAEARRFNELSPNDPEGERIVQDLLEALEER